MTENKLTVGVIGGLGLMSAPMAKHWKPGGPVQAVRVHDRGNPGANRDLSRAAWREHGAKLVSSLKELIEDGDLDGVFVCCGKNGDDLAIIASVADQLSKRPGKPKFICHMSTVSVGFAQAAHCFCQKRSVRYVNYPLTGSAAGAQAATMLILAGGETRLYEELLPALSMLGKPRHFGPNVAAGAEVKLMGHLMVFNGLFGVSSAAALHAECLNGGRLGGPLQTEFFDFLNTGAGGTKQWDLILKCGISNDIWDAPFSLKYAAVDAIYLAQLCMDKGISRLVVEQVINTALAFSYVLNHVDENFATHAIAPEMLASRASALDRFVKEHSALAGDHLGALKKCVASFPEGIRKRVALNISERDFKEASDSN